MVLIHTAWDTETIYLCNEKEILELPSLSHLPQPDTEPPHFTLPHS